MRTSGEESTQAHPHKVRQPAKFVGRGGALDCLRFLAAMSIVIYHYGGEAPVPLDQVNLIFQRGYLATDFFLILSGFIMARVYSEALFSGAITPIGFVLHRLRRVWPGHLIVLAALVALVLVASVAHVTPGHPEHFVWKDLLPQIFLIQSWGDYGGGGWNLPSWSLSALIACYTITPLALRAARLVDAPHVIIALAVIGLAATNAVSNGMLHRSLYDLPFQFGALRAIPLFLLGLATAHYSMRAPAPRRVAEALFLGAITCLILLQSLGRFDFLSMTAVATVLFCAGSNPVKHPSRLWQSASQLSFAVFITHILTATLYFGALHQFERRFPMPLLAQWAAWSLSLPFALVTAIVFDHFIDRPLQERLKLKARVSSLTGGLDVARS